jgi:vitamin B12 transporter
VAPIGLKAARLLRGDTCVSSKEENMITALLLASTQISPSAVPPTEVEGNGEDIVITASLTPVSAAQAPASVTVFEADTIELLGLTLASDIVRLSPGVAVATTGAQGTETVVRIRGAESNHTLIFIDGIAFNDIAAANAARFDALTAGGLSRIELIRGPQSALWGSEALGGVVAMNSPDPLGEFRARGLVEYGNRDFVRAEAEIATGGDRSGLSATAGWARSDGIDILGGGTGDRDGFENLTLSLKGLTDLGPIQVGAVGRYIDHEIAFDGTDPATFARADTPDVSAAETLALRGWLGFATDEDAVWSGKLEVQHLDSENRNRLGTTRTIDTAGRRLRFGGRISRRLELGSTRHELTAALEREEEDYERLDHSDGSRLHQSRGRTAFVGEWRASWGDRLVTDLAVRHDDFNRFLDATTLRAQAVLNAGGGFQILAGYGEGIAQPSFTDLFGFPGFPFVGNPDLRPEHSQGFEAGLRYSGSGLSLEAIAFSNNLDDEIVPDFSVFPSTVINAAGSSRRRGLELSGEWRPSPAVQIGVNYTYLDAREGGSREIRRPEHTTNAFADWRLGPLTVGVSLAYVGPRTDRDFDLFPSPLVRLDDYVLGSLRVAYRIRPQLEAYARVENGFDADYQDVFGYNTQGRSVHAGLRLALDR